LLSFKRYNSCISFFSKYFNILSQCLVPRRNFKVFSYPLTLYRLRTFAFSELICIEAALTSFLESSFPTEKVHSPICLFYPWISSLFFHISVYIWQIPSATWEILYFISLLLLYLLLRFFFLLEISSGWRRHKKRWFLSTTVCLSKSLFFHNPISPCGAQPFLTFYKIIK